MSDQRVTAAGITMIPIIIAIAVALAGFLMANKIPATNDRSAMNWRKCSTNEII